MRLPDQLKGVDFTEAKLIKISNKEVKFIFNNITYIGVIAKLPTIIEAQKNIDDKLYKVSNVSTFVVIYANKSINIDEEINKLEKSGLTPPMTGITDVWRSILPPDDTEQQVAELLAEDAKAVKVEIIENVENTADIDEFAAELENAIPMESEKNEENAAVMEKSGDLNEEIKQETEMVVSNEIISVKVEEDVNKEETDNQLLEIKNKIKEKKKLLENALNPILKKRFMQAIEELENEYEKKKEKKKNGDQKS